MQARNYSEKLWFHILPGILLFLSALVSVGCGAPFATTLSVTPGNSTIALGETAQLKVIAHYTDGSSEDVTHLARWMTLNTGVAAVSSTGLASSVKPGTATIVADAMGMTGNATLTVANAALTGISIAAPAAPLAVGLSEQLKATGTYTDKSTADITNAVEWSTSQTAILSINTAGLATATAAGKSQITISLKNFTASSQITVVPAALTMIGIQSKSISLPLGTQEQLTASGVFTDGTSKDVTASAVWTSAAPNIVGVGGGGAVLAKGVGSASVSATLSGITGSTTLQVSTAALVSIGISAGGAASVPVGQTLQLSAIGKFTDGSTQDLTGAAAWTSSSPDVLTVRSQGLVAAISVGSADVTATLGGLTGVQNLTVSAPVLTSISLAPAAPTVPLGSSLQLAVTGAFSDGSNQDVTAQATWSVDSAVVAAITPTGMVTGLQAGSTGIEVSVAGQQTADTLTVQPLLAVNYFDTTSGADSTIRITNPGMTGQDLCAMVYVFDQDQQMSECCGCLVSQDGLLTLSLMKNLLNNPLTGMVSKSGTVMLVSAAQGASGGCDASSVMPAGNIIAWSTRLPASQSGLSLTEEDAFSSSGLTATSSAALQAQCAFVQQLGSGQGLCGCGGTQ